MNGKRISPDGLLDWWRDRRAAHRRVVVDASSVGAVSTRADESSLADV